MKTYLRISALIFLLVGIAHTLIITGTIGPFSVLNSGAAERWQTFDVPIEANWTIAAVAYLLFLFGFLLSFTAGKRNRKLQKREAEVSSLIEILQDGRKQQLALLELLQTKDLQPEEPSEEIRTNVLND